MFTVKIANMLPTKERQTGNTRNTTVLYSEYLIILYPLNKPHLQY